MSVDFISKIIRGGSTFNFADPYELEKWSEEEYNRTAQAAETPGADGEWQGGSTAGARLLTTAKDVMRLAQADRDRLGVEVVPVELIFDDDNAVADLLRSVLGEGT